MIQERPIAFFVQISYAQRPLGGHWYVEFVAGGLPAMSWIWVHPGEVFRQGVSNAVEHAHTTLSVMGIPPLLTGRFHESDCVESPVPRATPLVNTESPVAFPGLLSEVVFIRVGGLSPAALDAKSWYVQGLPGGVTIGHATAAERTGHGNPVTGVIDAGGMAIGLGAKPVPPGLTLYL